MAQRSVRRSTLIAQGRENSGSNPQFPSGFIKKEEGGALPPKSLVSEEEWKREFPLEEAKPKRQRKQKETAAAKPKKKKRDNSADRWSTERYKQAEQRLLEILKAEGAVFGKPISRPQLRMAGRRHIGDTGLLDHLLKHIDGKVAPGGTERFKRWHNTDGVMEYWLESAELDRFRLEAGILDPYWVPPSGWKPDSSGALEDLVSSSDVKLIKEELFNVKRELAELVSKKKDQDQVNNLVQAMHKEYVNLQAKINQCDIERSNSLSGLQNKYQDITAWKVLVEQQLMELTNSLSSIQATKAYTHPLGPVCYERSEDWFESNHKNGQDDDMANWMIITDPSNAKGEVELYSSLATRSDVTPAQDADYASELAVLKNEVSMIKRDMKELLHRQQDDCLPNWNRVASLNVNSQLDFENPSLLFPKWKEMADWRTKMDHQMKEVLNAVRSMQATKPLTPFNPSPAFYS